MGKLSSVKLISGARKVRDHSLLSSPRSPSYLLHPQNIPRTRQHSPCGQHTSPKLPYLPSPRAAHVQSSSLCALSCTVSFQLGTRSCEVSCSKASDLRILSYKKALFYVSFENSFFSHSWHAGSLSGTEPSSPAVEAQGVLTP